MSVAISRTIAIVAVAMLWPLAANGQNAPAQVPAPAPAPDEPQHEHAAPAELPPFVPLVTDADRKAAFPELTTHAVHDDAVHSFLLFDRFEGRAGDGGGLAWDAKGWIGGDVDRFAFRTEGSGDEGRVDEGHVHALYGRAIARWWDLVAGIRQDVRPGRAQTWAAVGIQGLAPYRFDLEATGYVGAHGRTELRLEAEYELLITNRLILQPLLEIELYGTSDPERGVGAGLGTTDAGLRLRYEFRRELAPYVGVTWNRKYFGTADLARAAGERAGSARLAVGLRFWL